MPKKIEYVADVYFIIIAFSCTQKKIPGIPLKKFGDCWLPPTPRAGALGTSGPSRSPDRATVVLFYSVGLFFRLALFVTACPSPTCCSIIARTFSGRPNNVMKPWASLWLYSSPVVKDAMDSL